MFLSLVTTSALLYFHVMTRLLYWSVCSSWMLQYPGRTKTSPTFREKPETFHTTIRLQKKFRWMVQMTIP